MEASYSGIEITIKGKKYNTQILELSSLYDEYLDQIMSDPKECWNLLDKIVKPIREHVKTSARKLNNNSTAII